MSFTGSRIFLGFGLGASVVASCGLRAPATCASLDDWDGTPTVSDAFADARAFDDGVLYFTDNSPDRLVMKVLDPSTGDAKPFWIETCRTPSSTPHRRSTAGCS